MLFFFPRGVLDEILNLIESVSEGFPSYFWYSLNFPGCLRLSLSWFNWWVSFAPVLQCCYLFESSCLFYLSFNFDFYVSK